MSPLMRFGVMCISAIGIALFASCANTTYFGDPHQDFDGPDCWVTHAWLDSLRQQDSSDGQVEFVLSVYARPSKNCSGFIRIDSLELRCINDQDTDGRIITTIACDTSRPLFAGAAVDTIVTLDSPSCTSIEVWALYSVFGADGSPVQTFPMKYLLNRKHIFTVGGP